MRNGEVVGDIKATPTECWGVGNSTWEVLRQVRFGDVLEKGQVVLKSFNRVRPRWENRTDEISSRLGMMWADEEPSQDGWTQRGEGKTDSKKGLRSLSFFIDPFGTHNDLAQKHKHTHNTHLSV